MGKVKIKKKETRIDMTAMSDVTVLLLTFFMLTSTFLQKEPVTVITPPSVSEEKVPDQNLVSVLISPKGQLYLSITGSKDSTFKSEVARKEILKNAVAEYNQVYNKKIELTGKQIEEFSKIGSFGVPMNHLVEWLDAPTIEKRDEMLKNGPGIPYPYSMKKLLNIQNPSSAIREYDEFQIWMRAALKYASGGDAAQDEFKDALLRDGTGIAIKADQTTPYEIISDVMNDLQTIKMNKFSLMTALKSEED